MICVQEVDARLSEALSSAAQEEVEEELRQLQAEEAAISAGAVPQKMPAVGTHEPAVAESSPVAATSAAANRVRLPA